MATLALAGCGSEQEGSFTLSASPSSPTVGPGNSTSCTITVTGQNGFDGSVSLSASGLPNGVTVSFIPPTTKSTSVLTLTASSAATLGNATVTTRGTSENLSQTVGITLTVAVPNVTVSLSPQVAAVAATSQTQQFTATVTGNTSNLGVAWGVDGAAGGSALTGTISVSGLYTPPARSGTHVITATSVANPADSGSASVAVTDL